MIIPKSFLVNKAKENVTGLFDDIHKPVYQLYDKKLFFEELEKSVSVLSASYIHEKTVDQRLIYCFFTILSYSELPSFGSGGSGGEEGFSSLLEGVVEPGS